MINYIIAIPLGICLGLLVSYPFLHFWYKKQKEKWDNEIEGLKEE